MLSTKRCWLVLVLAFALPARAQTGSQASIEGMVWDPSGAVVASAAHAGSTRLWVLRDDAWLPREASGADVRVDDRGASYIQVSWPRLYDVALPDGKTHVVKLSPEDPGFTLHAFVFEPVPPVAPARP